MHKGLATLVAIMALGLSAATATADTTWSKLSGDFSSNLTTASLAVSGSNVVAAWTQQASPSAADIDVATFATALTADIGSRSDTKAAAGWAFLGSDPTLLASAGGLQLAFDGIHSTSSSDPLDGVILAQRNADGSFAAPQLMGNGAGSSGVSGALLVSGAPLVATGGAGGINIFRGPGPAAAVAGLQAQLGGCCGYVPSLGTDAQGRLWVAWYSNATGHTGLYVQQLDPATGSALGSPAQAPQSESVDNNNSWPTMLACAAACRVVYGAPGNNVVSWAPGESAPTTIAKLPADSAGRVVAAAYRADGRLWVAWYDGTTFRYTLGDATGAHGAIADAGRPPLDTGTTPFGTYSLRALAVGDNLLLVSDWAHNTSSTPLALYVNLVAPPLSATPAPGPRDVDLQTGPGGKGFRIQVQYRVPSFCKPSCRASAELRTRSGRRLYAAGATAPLPGDGKVVIGTRGSVKLPGGKKVRFYMTVSGKQLLKARPFTTQGGYRVTNTRLRVWLQTPSGRILTVRDGRIRVSIARIKSGALPGLRGIL